MKLLAITTLFPTLLFFTASLLSGVLSNSKRKAISFLTMFAAGVSVAISIAGGVYIFNNGSAEFSFFSFENLGLSFRIDALSILFFGMIALLAVIIVKYSINYLDGDHRQGVFIGRIAATIASVQLFVLSGNLLILFLAWVLTSLFLHRLLVFYRDRPRAITAATKKFIVARIADIFLLISFMLLYNKVGSGSLTTIFEAIALAGDLNMVAQRDQVSLIRQYPDGTRIHRLNLLDQSIIDSPYYFIQPNDVIYVEPMKQKSFGIGVTGAQTITTIISVVSTSLALILAIQGLNN